MKIMSEMDKLENYLKEKGIRYTRQPRFDEDIRAIMKEAGEDPGEQIIVYELGRRSWDAVCGYGTYGAIHGLLEVMGRRVVRSSREIEKVNGWLTAQDIIDRLEGRE